MFICMYVCHSHSAETLHQIDSKLDKFVTDAKQKLNAVLDIVQKNIFNGYRNDEFKALKSLQQYDFILHTFYLCAEIAGTFLQGWVIMAKIIIMIILIDIEIMIIRVQAAKQPRTLL